MPWTTPKTDWDTNPTNPLPSDFNRIEGNIDFLNTDIETKKGLIVDALNSVGIAALIADTHVQLASKITGAKKTGVSITPGIANQEIPKGIYDTGGGVVVGDANLIGINIKPGVSIFGVSGAIPSKGAATITPGTTNQIISAGQYLTGDQTVAGDADLISANIKAGANIFGVAGNSNVVDTSGGDATAAQILSGKKAYVDGALVTGTIPSKGAATITPGTVNQNIAAGQYLSGIQTIAGSSNLAAANIKEGVNLFGIIGSCIPAPSLLSSNIHFYCDANGYLRYSTNSVADSVTSPEVVTTNAMLIQIMTGFTDVTISSDFTFYIATNTNGTVIASSSYTYTENSDYIIVLNPMKRTLTLDFAGTGGTANWRTLIS